MSNSAALTITPDYIIGDHLIFTPDHVDLSFSPLRKSLKEKTFVLGAFNPGVCRLGNGNLLLMVRVAEALLRPVIDGNAYSIRWDRERGYQADAWPLADVSMTDPRKFRINAYSFPVYALTSLSWLLPVELNADGSSITRIHYDKIISPQYSSQEYGIEDARISFIDNRYYMTTCCVSSERHSTMLYVSEDGLSYRCLGIVLDHQNKDMLLFGEKINGRYYALTRPMGECYFASSPSASWHPGASIQLASSPDLLHWKPWDAALLRACRSSSANVKIGGGAPPFRTKDGWLILYHGVEKKEEVGIYRTFWAILDRNDPSRLLHLEDEKAFLEANSSLTGSIGHQIYLNDVVFTTGIAEHEEDFLIVSGELDLACRITRIPKKYFSI